MGTLVAYLDESGTQRGSPALSVAGYLANPSQWEKFEREWRQALLDFGIEYFHMTDFAGGWPPYDTWSPADKRERLTRLLGIIYQNVPYSVGAVIPTQAYQAAFQPKDQKAFGGLYGIAAASVALAVGQAIRQSGEDVWVDYRLESGAEGKGEILKMFTRHSRLTGSKPSFHIRSVELKDKRQFGALQAADILAYELYKYLARLRGLDSSPPGEQVALLAAVEQKQWLWLDEEQLKVFAEIVSLAPRDQRTPGKQKKRR